MKTKRFHDIMFPCLDRIEGSLAVIYDEELDCDWSCEFPLALCEKGTNAIIAWLNNTNPLMKLEFEYSDEL